MPAVVRTAARAAFDHVGGVPAVADLVRDSWEDGTVDVDDRRLEFVGTEFRFRVEVLHTEAGDQPALSVSVDPASHHELTVLRPDGTTTPAAMTSPGRFEVRLSGRGAASFVVAGSAGAERTAWVRY